MLLIDRVERSALAAVSGGANVNPEEQRDKFDEWLLSEVELIDAETADLNRALGVGRWRR